MPPAIKSPRRAVVRGSTLTEADDAEVEFELDSPDQFFGSHINLIPLRSAVAGPRLFYGARFYNQALPLQHAEAPLVQSLADRDEAGRSFDEILGKAAGARFARGAGVVRDITPDWIELEGPDGVREQVELYNKLPFNRKTSLTNTPVVKIGDQVQPGQVLARSNFTDKDGRLAMGLNARIGLVPYLGKSMDDAVVVSDSFARRLASEHLYGYDLDNRNGVKLGKAHYAGVFPGRFVKDQLDKLDDDGVIQPGMVVQPGDPLILATRPRVVSSTSAQLGLLSKHMKNARTNAALLWDHDEPGTVTDVVRLPDGSAKVNVQVIEPTKLGDKVVLRSGQKGIISEILSDDQMPRTTDGKPLEVLLNPLGIPSRVNNSLVYELLLGKVARRSGKPLKLPSFLPEGQRWDAIVEQHLKDAGLSDTEEVYDPKFGRKLERPVTVGDGYILKLHHTSASKISTRGQGSYTSNEQPAHGGGENAQAKRLSGLESRALLSSGAYNVLREGATLRGQRNDEYWRQLRMGLQPRDPGRPFMFSKFLAMLSGAGYLARKMPKDQYRLQFFTDRDLDELKPMELDNGEIVDIGTFEPVKGGLFDPSLTGRQSWGAIRLPQPMPNPAAEDVIRKLLGLTQKEFRAVLAGEMELPAETLARLKNDQQRA